MENILLLDEYVDIKSYKIRALIELLEKLELKHDLFYKKQFAFNSVVFNNLYRSNFIESYDKKGEKNLFFRVEKERFKNEIKKLKKLDEDMTLLSNDNDILLRNVCFRKYKLTQEILKTNWSYEPTYNLITGINNEFEISEILYSFVSSLWGF